MAIDVLSAEQLATIALSASTAPTPAAVTLARLSTANVRAYAATFPALGAQLRAVSAEAIVAAASSLGTTGKNTPRALRELQRLEHHCFGEDGVDYRSALERALTAELQAALAFELELERGEAAAAMGAAGRPELPGEDDEPR